MNTLLLFAALFFCMAIGMPIAVSLGLSSLLTIFFFSQDSLPRCRSSCLRPASTTR
jgi:C4-dicarboxylate transporter, DctM subunit